MYPQPLDRRTFLADLGRGAFALAVVAVAACGPDAGATRSASASATASSPGPGTGGPPGGSPGASEAPTGGSDGPPADLTWARVNLGFVSAYVLVRDGEAAIVDTGVAGSADAIEEALSGVGLGWDTVGHLVLTHHHGDHVGSAADVLSRAPDAAAYAGAEDIGAITGLPRPLAAVGDGDEVFGLQVVTTPGHTAGSISVLDRAAGVLVAGDALRTEGGRPALPGAQFTVDMDQARTSVAKLGGLAFETLLVGHGEPIESGASGLVAELGAG